MVEMLLQVRQALRRTVSDCGLTLLLLISCLTCCPCYSAYVLLPAMPATVRQWDNCRYEFEFFSKSRGSRTLLINRCRRIKWAELRQISSCF